MKRFVLSVLIGLGMLGVSGFAASPQKQSTQTKKATTTGKTAVTRHTAKALSPEKTARFKAQCLGGKQSACKQLVKSSALPTPTRCDAISCNDAGIIYNLADEQDTAFKYFGRACKLGDADGCLNVGFAYSNGHGVSKDEVVARKYFIKSCQMGDADGCKNAGVTKKQALAMAKKSAKKSQRSAQKATSAKSAKSVAKR